MARVKNVVYRVVLDLNNPATLDREIKLNHQRVRDLRQHDATVMPKMKENLQRSVAVPLRRALQVYPPRKPGMRIRWKSRKQQRYVMWLLRSSGNLPYRRSGRLARGWVVLIEVSASRGSVRMITYNDAQGDGGKRYMRFVQGDIGLGRSSKSLRSYNRPIQPFHTDRGWQPAAPVIQSHYAAAEEKAIDTHLRALRKIIRRTAS